MSIRISSLALEYRVTSRWVIDRLAELGITVRAASSLVPQEVAEVFEKVWGSQLAAGVNSNDVVLGQVDSVLLGRARSAMSPLARTRAQRSFAPRNTSWDESEFDAAGRAMWQQAGLGENDSELAWFLLQHGVIPEDLSIRLRGTSAVSRLRSGMESRTLLVDELIEARSTIPQQRQPLPSRAVTRRFIEKKQGR